MKLARRSFLQLMGAAPIAAPVIAREAAAKAGVAAMPLPSFEQDYFGGINPTTESGLPWAVERLRDLDAPEAFSKALAAVGRPRLLDPDLASSRSLSLSAAMRIQREREARAKLEEGRLDALFQFKRIYGADWGGIASWLAAPLQERKS